MKNSILFLTIFILIGTGCNTAKKSIAPPAGLEGTWKLNYISGTRIAFDGLYPEKKPEITFDTIKNELSGNSSCNGFGCKYTLVGSTISFTEPIGTMMACEGEGEQSFYRMLKKVNKYSVDASTLNFLMDDVAVMRFSK